ncbi:MAG TPA: DinB family protein [Candidatus Kapabacteria bacterium]|nr:DinB family protein [Candidatus Kapabacteria bacterium]
MQSELETIREHLQRYRSVTLQLLDLVPEDALHRHVAEGARSFADLFMHIAQVEEFHITGLFQDRWDFGGVRPPADPPTRRRVQAELAATRSVTLDAIASLAEEDLTRSIAAPGIPASWPLRSWLWYLVEHEIHHKAQITDRLVALGIDVPFWAFALPAGMRPDRRPQTHHG